MSITVRCMAGGCKARTEANLTEGQHDAYVNAVQAGKDGDWKSYWNFMREIDARCFHHEDL